MANQHVMDAAALSPLVLILAQSMMLLISLQMRWPTGYGAISGFVDRRALPRQPEALHHRMPLVPVGLSEYSPPINSIPLACGRCSWDSDKD